MYSIVQFRDGIQLVPTLWILEDNKCSYPPYLSQSRVDQAIEKRELPKKDWSVYRILRVFDTANTVRFHHPSITEIEVANYVAKWLVPAKLRKTRAEEKTERRKSELFQSSTENE